MTFFDSSTYPLSIVFTLRKLITTLRISQKKMLLNHSLLKSHKLPKSSYFWNTLYYCRIDLWLTIRLLFRIGQRRMVAYPFKVFGKLFIWSSQRLSIHFSSAYYSLHRKYHYKHTGATSSERCLTKHINNQFYAENVKFYLISTSLRWNIYSAQIAL